MLRPLGTTLLARKIEAEHVRPSGLITTAPVNDLPRFEVEAVGRGRLLDNGDISPLEVQVGDVVISRGEGYGTPVVNTTGQSRILFDVTEIVAIEGRNVD